MTRDEQSPEPIDAEFTPSASPGMTDAPASGSAVRATNPVGYGALVVASVAAALAGGAIGVVAGGRNGIDSAAFAPAEVRVDIDRIAVAQKDLADRQLMLRGELADLQARGATAADLGRVEAGLGQAVRDLSVLRADIDAISAGRDPALPIEEPVSPAGEAPTADRGGLAALAGRIDGLEARIAALETQRPAAPTRANGQTLAVRPATPQGADARVQSVAGQSASRPSRADNPLLYTAGTGSGQAAQALETLAQAIELGQPALPPARALAALLPRNADASALVTLAEGGVASLSALRRDFESARRGPQAKPAVTHWWDRMLSGVVVVRRPAPGLRGPAINEADAALARGDLAAALAAVERLPADLQPGFADWKVAAARRLEAQARFDAIAKILAPG